MLPSNSFGLFLGEGLISIVTAATNSTSHTTAVERIIQKKKRGQLETSKPTHPLKLFMSAPKKYIFDNGVMVYFILFACESYNLLFNF
jgi:hypothetical protein